jgi:hypothetical protein
MAGGGGVRPQFLSIGFVANHNACILMSFEIRFKGLMALSSQFWGMTGDEQCFTPLLACLFLCDHICMCFQIKQPMSFEVAKMIFLWQHIFANKENNGFNNKNTNPKRSSTWLD